MPTITPIISTSRPTNTGDLCGSEFNRYCYYINIYSSIHDDTQFEQSIVKFADNVATTFDLYFIARNNICLSPSITLIYELIDYDGSSEYIDVYDNNNVLIQRCGGEGIENMCGVFGDCISNKSLETNQINIGDTYHIQLVESSDVDALCFDHQYSINAKLTLHCSKEINAITTFMPTTLPTKHPITPLDPYFTSTVSPNANINNNGSTDSIKQTKTSLIIIITLIIVGFILSITLCILVFIYFKKRKGKQIEMNKQPVEMTKASKPIIEREGDRLTIPMTNSNNNINYENIDEMEQFVDKLDANIAKINDDEILKHIGNTQYQRLPSKIDENEDGEIGNNETK
eukprot:494371_1